MPAHNHSAQSQADRRINNLLERLLDEIFLENNSEGLKGRCAGMMLEFVNEDPAEQVLERDVTCLSCFRYE